MPQVTPIAGIPCAWAATMSKERSPTITARVGPSSCSARPSVSVLPSARALRSGPATTEKCSRRPIASSSGSVSASGLEVATASRRPSSASSASGMPGATVVSVSEAVL